MTALAATAPASGTGLVRAQPRAPPVCLPSQGRAARAARAATCGARRGEEGVGEARSVRPHHHLGTLEEGDGLGGADPAAKDHHRVEGERGAQGCTGRQGGGT